MKDVYITHYCEQWHVYIANTNRPIFSASSYEFAYDWAKEYVACYQLTFGPAL